MPSTSVPGPVCSTSIQEPDVPVPTRTPTATPVPISRRRLFRTAGAAGLAPTAALAACVPGTQESAPTQSRQPVTLRFVPAGFHADLDQIVVDQYHAENPHVTINFEP